MDHSRAHGGGSLRHGARAFRLHGLESLWARWRQDADEVDGDVSAAHRGLDGSRITQVGLNGVNLTDLAERLEVTGKLRPTHRDPNAVVALAKRTNHGPAQK